MAAKGRLSFANNNAPWHPDAIDGTRPSRLEQTFGNLLEDSSVGKLCVGDRSNGNRGVDLARERTLSKQNLWAMSGLDLA
jgi:hypothetical protein